MYFAALWPAGYKIHRALITTPVLTVEPGAAHADVVAVVGYLVKHLILGGVHARQPFEAPSCFIGNVGASIGAR